MGTEIEGVENPPIQLKNGMIESVKYLQNYMNTYSNQEGYEDYSVRIYIEDILYGLGVSIDENKYQWAEGFREFKKDLMQFLVENP